MQAEANTGGLAAKAARAFESYQDGDPSGMSALVDLVTTLLWHTARTQGLSQSEAEDVVQNTWLRLVQHVARIDDPQGILKWLITTTRRESWVVSKRARRVDLIDTMEVVDGPSQQGAVAGPEQIVLRGEAQATVWAHYRLLPRRCQTLLRVIALAERPDYARVAEALGMPIGSIGPTRGRCLAKLRAALTADPTWTEA